MIENIKFKETEFYEDYFFNSQEEKRLENLSKINLFVGANNTGKSRFLRRLFKSLIEANTLKDRYKGFDNNSISFELYNKDELLSLIQNFLEKINPLVSDELENTLVNISNQVTNQFDLVDPLIDEIDLEELINFNSNLLYSLLKEENKIYDRQVKLIEDSNSSVVDLNNEINSFIESLEKKLPKNFKADSLINYIPPTRTLKKFIAPLESESKTKNNSFLSGKKFRYIEEPLLKQKILHDYFNVLFPIKVSGFFQDDEINYSTIETGEDFYERISLLRNSPDKERNKLANFENFLSKNFFQNRKIDLNAFEIDDRKEIYLKIGDDKEFPIYNLGDGVQAIIILIFSLFENEGKNHFIFYEEPELYLHPGFQRIFLEALLKIDNVQVFIATHSNHFLDLSLESKELISIYSFQKKLQNKKNIFEIENLNSFSHDILDNLGVRNSSVFLSNCTIWIEGISDEIYLRKYLELYFLEKKDNSFKEDIHYSFVEYNGSNLEHWSFENSENTQTQKRAFSLANRIFLISDKDKGKEEKHDAFKKILGDNYYSLESLEIENLLSPSVLKRTLLSYKLDKISSLKVSDFNLNDYKNKPMGEFIYTVVDKNKIKKIASTPEKGQTGRIYNKLDFAKSATNYIEEWTDLSEEAKSLTSNLVDFIKSNNK